METIFQLKDIVTPICEWYGENHRSMPWRDAPSPYHVWVSEIMLQQTRIEAVKAYYAKFIERLPQIRDLAEISDEELLKLWEGLGYYSRVKNMKKAARLVMEEYDGALPDSYEELKKLPGIGNYTAGAVASIAYRVPAPAVDGNVLRVLMRYLNCEEDIMKMALRHKVERSIMAVIPGDKPGDFNQGIMELGETICIPNGIAKCEQCPIREKCQARIQDRVMELPVKTQKKARKIEKKTVFIPMQGSQVGICKRSDRGLLAGLWEFPWVEGNFTKKILEEYLQEQDVSYGNIQKLQPVKHIFSHVEWHMNGYRVEMKPDQAGKLTQDIVWVSKEELANDLALPVAFQGFWKQIYEK